MENDGNDSIGKRTSHRIVAIDAKKIFSYRKLSEWESLGVVAHSVPMHYTCELVNTLRNPPIDRAAYRSTVMARIDWLQDVVHHNRTKGAAVREEAGFICHFDDFIVSLASSFTFHICISYHNYVRWLAFHSRGHIHWRARNAMQATAAAANTECTTPIILTLFRAASVRCLFCICLVFVWVLLWGTISWPNNYLAAIEYIIKFLSILFGTIGFLAVILSYSRRFDCWTFYSSFRGMSWNSFQLGAEQSRKSTVLG